VWLKGWRLEGFGQRADLFARVYCAATDEYDGCTGRTHEPGCLFNGVGIHFWPAHGEGDWTVAHFRLGGEDVYRRFQPDGPGAA